MRSARLMVESRWAMIRVVRPSIRRSRALCTRASDSASRALVASSRISTRGSRSMARAIAIRWRWPPDSLAPRSPMLVS